MATAEDVTSAELLVKNVALEKEVDAVKTILNDTAEQRNGFRAHADTLTTEVVRLRQQCDDLTGQLSATEREHNEARSQWAEKIEQAEHEFAEMLTREELEAMRLQLVEQAEAPWRARTKVLEGELASAGETAATLRREAERARSALESAQHEHRAALREAEVKHETSIAELRSRLELLDSSRPHDEPSASERNRRLQREHAESTVRATKLFEEVEELRRENDGLLALRNQLLGAQATAAGEARAADRLNQSERESLQRKVGHLQAELDSAIGVQERLHESVLRAETEMRALRAAADDAQHAVASEKASSALKLADATREVDKLKLELDRRHMESLRREALLQRSRDELAASAAQHERDAAAQIAQARDDDHARVKRIEGERSRLAEQLAAAQSDGMAASAAARDRADAAAGEVASLKAELHGATLETSAAVDEAARLRRRTVDAEERLSGALSELQALRLEASEVSASKGHMREMQAAAAAAKEKLQAQLEVTQSEASRSRAELTQSVEELQAKLRHSRRVIAKEKSSASEHDATRTRQVEALKRETARLRGEREQLKRELRDAGLRSSAAANVSPTPMLGEGSVPLELQSLVAEEAAILREASLLKQQAAGIAQAVA